VAVVLDWRNCSCLLHPRERLAGGGVCAFQLPDPVTAAGEARGGAAAGGRAAHDSYRCVLDPQGMKPTIERKMRELREEQERRQRKGQRQRNEPKQLGAARVRSHIVCSTMPGENTAVASR
jgi:hypothetical protein